MNNFPHKFVSTHNPAGKYTLTVFCEYCGMVVFYHNRPDDYKTAVTEAQKGCPCSPTGVVKNDNS